MPVPFSSALQLSRNVESLKTGVMRFGQRSSHPMGIGVYGVGLNRALFKLGKVSHLKTDTGKERAELILNTVDYLKSDDWELPAEEFPSKGVVGTEIEIRQLPSDIAQNFADDAWVDSLRDELGRRYGRFIEKKLVLLVNKKAVRNLEPQIRDDGPFDPQYKFYKTEEGVAIHIQYGQNVGHRFTSEPDYDAERNKAIPAETGWTVLCNERAILLSDQTHKTGWDTKFHTEFYGFVGSVSFVGDPEKLPWNTTKIDVDLNNPAYQMALKDMRRFTEDWRSFAEKRKKAAAKGEKLKPLPPKAKPAAGASPGAGVGAKAKTTQKAAAKPVTKIDHNQFRTVLPDDVNEVHCFDKHLALVREAKSLDLVDYPYSGLALIRMLFESSVVTYMERHAKMAALKQFAIDKRKKKIKLSVEAEKKLVPSMDEMLAYFESEPAVWGAKENYLRHNVSKMGAHQKTMNTVLHNPYQLTHKTQAVQIRDEVLPLLRHLIEK